MLNLITSYLIQAGECSLPGLGTFSMVTQPSRIDIANKEIFPPETICQFTQNTVPLAKGFIHFIAVKKEMDDKQAIEAIQAGSKALKEQMNAGEVIQFPTIGTLQKDSYGSVIFTPEKTFTYYSPLPAVRVIHKEVNHALLVGDRESNSSEMNALLNAGAASKPNHSFWKIAAIILSVIGIGILFYHFYNSGGFGNSTKINPAAPENTYISK